MINQMRGKVVQVTVFLQELKDEENTGFLTRVGFLIGSDDKYVYLGEEDLTIFACVAHQKVVSIDLHDDVELDHSMPEGTNLN